MRIVLACGPSHRDDGGPFYAQRQLNRVPGVVCDRKTMLEPEPTWGEYDASLYVDWGQDCDIFKYLPEFIPNPAKPSLCWQSDTHWQPGALEYRFNQAVKYRTAAFCQKVAADLFATGPNNVKTVWLPHAADHTIYTPPLKDYKVNLDHLPPVPAEYEPYCCEAIPRWDLCFVGHPDDAGRRGVLDSVFKAIPNFAWRSGWFFRDAARVYHRSKIVFNRSVRGELNMRTFEGLATRSFLLTDRQEGMDLLGLQDGVHAALYDSTEEAIDKAKWYLDPARDALRRRIAWEGWEWYLKGHSYWHRVRTILEHIAPRV